MFPGTPTSDAAIAWPIDHAVRPCKKTPDAACDGLYLVIGGGYTLPLVV